MDQTKPPDPETLKNYKALICHVFYKLLSSAAPQFFRTWHPLWGLWQIILSPSRTSSFFPVHALKTQLTINIPAVQGNASEAFRRKKKKKSIQSQPFPLIFFSKHINVIQNERKTDTGFSLDCEALNYRVIEVSAMKEIPNEHVHVFKQEIIVPKLKDRDSDLTSEPHAVGSLSPER